MVPKFECKVFGKHQDRGPGWVLVKWEVDPGHLELSGRGYEIWSETWRQVPHARLDTLNLLM
ncbi:Uu.00g116020.m01.CDS01 [Anthostomella pinea]|uniref:Uu.00g116020.m01.CDS01 n=1 Tax=Anthostomella pinea TaxID=933095 RepID=A0AAI8VFV3_9PEZI|nr:Uu.00g116020.m01.CDS01 [Anthostomella pinea]